MFCLMAFGAVAYAQGDGGQGDLEQTRKQAGDLDRDRDRDQDRTKQYSKDQVRARLHKDIDAAVDLTAEQRAAMHANADACVDLGIDPAGLDALFPGEQKRNRVSAQTMLRLQNRVMTAAREGLPVEPVMAKVQEGRTKGVPDPLLEQACVRMENHVRAANQIMKRAMNDGLDPPGDPAQNRRMNTEMAQQMWRGTKEQDYDQLRERARLRLRDGSCSVEDLVSAGELGTRLMEAGVERERAMKFSGDALQQGYGRREMQQLRIVVAARHQRGEPMDGFMGDMEHCIGAGMGAGEMYNYMMRHGWMGPGDMYGPGGHQPTDPKGHGGKHGGDGDEGGQGGGGQGGGGSGNR
jgi:hypothetical protein